MSTLHKVKAYFGMAPLEDYEDEYYDDDRAPSRGYARRGERFADDDYDKGRYDRYAERGEGREYERRGRLPVGLPRRLLRRAPVPRARIRPCRIAV